jgi:triphosphatase
MAIETELKLRIAPEQLARLKRHGLLKAHSVSRPVTRRLYNIYYDTPKLELHESGIALRLRHTGRQWLQTLKGGGSVQAGLHRRNEWEIPVNGPALDFSGLSADWDEHLPRSWRKRLQPVFVTDFSRSSRMLDFHRAEIELCIDQGEIGTQQYSMPLCELELELKSGEPRQLFELALAILEIVPFELEIVSKAEQGYRLLSGYAMHPAKDVAPVLARTDTLEDALKALIWSCLQHFQGNLSGALGHVGTTGDDAEYLHQMRVALRRLRVVLRIAEKIRPDERLAALGREISALGAALGCIREWDVFIAQTLQPICTKLEGHPGLRALLADSEQQRAAGYAALRGATQARELQRLLLRFAIWMNGDYWLHSADGVRNIQDFAGHRLRKLAERFGSSGQHLDRADAARLHALRIAAKKLRYSAEFFAYLYDERKAASYVAALGAVQEVLGQINDVAAAQRLLDKLEQSSVSPAYSEAVFLVRAQLARDLSGQLAALRKCLQSFNKQPEFCRY